ncbi:MAG TPA: hypothetical protein VMJ10_35440 [Kofleriaceae bacterium]|nr:hypothetical protein [Kofleriaceae bacterium]
MVFAACNASRSPARLDGGAPPDADPGRDAAAFALVGATAATWLHEPVRLVFDAPLDPSSLATLGSTVTLRGATLDSSLVLDGDRALAVVVDPAARGLGELDVRVSGLARGTDGTVVSVATDSPTLLEPWSSLPVDYGTATASPALVVTALGGVIAAWSVGMPGARRVVVALLDRGEWQPLGAQLGANDAISASLALDGTGAPVAAWIDAGTAHVARWDGTTWSEYASPGLGTAVAVASPFGGGAPIVAVFSDQVSAFALASGAWQPLGAPIALGGVLGEPQLAVASPSLAAIEWIDTSNVLRVQRWTGAAWSALPARALGAPPTGFDRASIAARGDTIAIAWDQWAGSFTVLAAEVSGTATAWTPLGHALDIAVDGDASAPAIALDSSLAPIVAWTELVATAQRGAIARWSGNAWTIVGGPTWLPDATDPPTRAALALHAGDAPVVGASSAGTVVVARFDGPAIAGPGIASRVSLAGCTFSASSPPARLSQTGCFATAAPGIATPNAGLVPYDVVVELWTDGAKKRRWLGLPDGAALTATATGSLVPPAGSFVVKEFAIETTPGDPATRRAVETRFLVDDAELGWQGFSYRWLPDGSDATLQPDAEQTYAWPLDDGTTHVHFYPSRSDCIECHQSTYGPLLGVRAPELARWVDYGGTIADQLGTLANIGVVPPATSAAPFASPDDPSQTVELRVRGYMAANCAHCHNPSDVAVHDLRYTTPLAQTNLCPDITPGDPGASRVYELVSERPGMPPLGTLEPDPLAVSLLGEWIAQMTSCP